MIKISDYIVSFIAELGIKHVFILPGGQIMHLNESLSRNTKLQPIYPYHEQAVSMMAEAYSRTTDNYGVAFVTTGPGGTNAITGLMGAWLDSTPCMFISGQYRLENTIGDQKIRQTCLQSTDPVSLVKPITKYSALIDDPLKVKYHLEKAIYLSKNGRPGPVWLDIPLDIQGAIIDESLLISYNPVADTITYDTKLLSEQIDQIYSILSTAKRPVILAGNGIRLSHAINEFHELINKLKIPVLTSINGIDLIWDNHPYYFGRPNYWGQRAANFIIQNSDVLISIGAGLHLETTGFNYKAFAREALKIIVDIDSGELNKKTINPDIPVKCDAKYFINSLLHSSNYKYNNEISKWTEICRKWKLEFPLQLPEFLKKPEYVNPFTFVDILSDELSEKDVIIPGSAGTHFTTAVQCFKVKKGQRVFSEIGIGAMGHSLPSSIAACLANNTQRTICVTGDGGIQFNIQELQTVINYNLPIKIFMMNNNGYSSIKTTQKRYFNSSDAETIKMAGPKMPNTSKIAAAYGLSTMRINNQSELRTKIVEALNSKGPIFCEVMLDPEPELIPRLASKLTKDGKMVSSPLEDMFPFLDKEDFLAHMFIDPIE